MTSVATGGYTIRGFQRKDIQAVRNIMVRTFEEDFGTGYQPEIHTDVADLASAYLTDPRHVLFVAEDDVSHQVVAIAAVRDGALKPGLSPADLVARYDPETTAQLVRFYTLKEHRRRGIARSLFRSTLDFVVRDGGYALIALHTYPHSPGALGFWTSVGAEIVHDDTAGPSQAIFLEIPIARAAQILREPV